MSVLPEAAASSDPAVEPAPGVDPSSYDPTVHPAFVVHEAPAFDWTASGYVCDVLDAHGELMHHLDGSVARDLRPMLDRLEGIVKARVVTKDNLDRAAYLGIDNGDLLTLLYGRPAVEMVEYREEAKALVAPAWGALSPKGEISKRLERGTVMVQSPKDTLSRIVTNADGTQGVQTVLVRMATQVPENVLNYALSPAGLAALTAARKAVRLAKEAMHNFPEAAELFGNRLMLLNNELNSTMADGLEKAGYVLEPSKVSTPSALAQGASKKGTSSKTPT